MSPFPFLLLNIIDQFILRRVLGLNYPDHCLDLPLYTRSQRLPPDSHSDNFYKENELYEIEITLIMLKLSQRC